MKISDLEKVLGFTCLQDEYEDVAITSGYTSDLLSDVMGHCPDEAVFITIQAHKNSIAVASLKDCPAIVLANGRTAPEDMLEAAREEEIGIFTSQDNQFTISWKIHEAMQQG